MSAISSSSQLATLDAELNAFKVRLQLFEGDIHLPSIYEGTKTMAKRIANLVCLIEGPEANARLTTYFELDERFKKLEKEHLANTDEARQMLEIMDQVQSKTCTIL